MGDAIFGRENFRNEIVWAYVTPSGSKSWFPRKHDTILFYAKSVSAVLNLDAVRVPYAKNTLQRSKYVGQGFSPNRSKGNAPRNLTSADGKLPPDWWADIPSAGNVSRTERTGYPTQKPLALYERIIKASSNEGGMVLDPFAGCATTLVAAERLGRQWAGIDIWDGAFDIVKQRMEDNRQLLRDIPTLPPVETEPPIRTDDGEAAAPFIQVTERYREPGPRMSRQEMYEHLLAQYGSKCQGCDRTFDDARYLELDHNTPRSDGGINHITNRVLLCSPCNRAKSNTLTLSGLRRLNKRNGWMANQ